MVESVPPTRLILLDGDHTPLKMFLLCLHYYQLDYSSPNLAQHLPTLIFYRTLHVLTVLLPSGAKAIELTLHKIVGVVNLLFLNLRLLEGSLQCAFSQAISMTHFQAFLNFMLRCTAESFPFAAAPSNWTTPSVSFLTSTCNFFP